MPYSVGWEARGETGESHAAEKPNPACVQSFTYPLVERSTCQRLEKIFPQDLVHLSAMARSITDGEIDNKLVNRAYQYILNRILRGEIAVGAAISRRHLASELQMSVLPVAEALQRLEQEMLVESDRHIGTRVRIPTPQDIRGFCAVREALETQACRMFVERARTAERNQLKAMARQLDKLYEEHSENPEDFPPELLYELRVLHKNFHLSIAAGANSPFLYRQIEKTLNLVFCSFYDHLFGDRRLPYQWHGMLANAICDGTLEVADQATRHHVQRNLEDTMYRLEEFFTLDRERFAEATAPRTAVKLGINISHRLLDISLRR